MQVLNFNMGSWKVQNMKIYQNENVIQLFFLKSINSIDQINFSQF